MDITNNMNNKSLGLITYVYEDYQDFIPLYVYSVLKNNPSVNIKIFLKEVLTKENRAMLEKVSTDKVEIVENYFIPCPIGRLGGIRVLIPEKDVSEFDYIYITDIDVVEVCDMREHCNKSILLSEKRNVPFNGRFYDHQFRHFKGLLPRFNLCCVFIEVKPYYEKMNKVIENIYSDKHQEYMNKIDDFHIDEPLFYYMLKQAFEFDDATFKKRGVGLPFLNLHPIKVGYKGKNKNRRWIPSNDIEKALVKDIYENGTEKVKYIIMQHVEGVENEKD